MNSYDRTLADHRTGKRDSMRKTPGVSIALFVLFVFLVDAPAKAAITLAIDRLPASYVPGELLELDVFLEADDAASEALELKSFDIAMTFALPAGAGQSFMIAVAREPGSDYLFGNYVPGFGGGAQRNGFLGVGDVSADMHSAEVSFGDVLFGDNKELLGAMRRRLAVLTIQTSATTTGDITLGIDSGFSEIVQGDDTSIGFLTPFVGSSISATAIPEPSSLSFLAFIGCAVFANRRKRR